MIQLSDAELCMLEQLTYLDEEVAAAAGINDKFGKINYKMIGHTLGDILHDFNEEALFRLSLHTNSVCDGAISGMEWVQIISYIQQNEKLSSLKLRDLYTTETFWNGSIYQENFYHAAVLDGPEWVWVGTAKYSEEYMENDTYPFLLDMEREGQLVRFPLGLCFVEDGDPNSAIIA
jgi:hypothetical protein